MSRPYAPRSFLRHIPAELLREFFTMARLPSSVEWDEVADGDIEPVFAAWQALPPTDRERVEQAFRQVHDLATEDGVRALVTESKFQNRDKSEQLERLDGHYAKVLWAYIHDQPVFEVAATLYHADSLSPRFWRKRNGFPQVVPDERREAIVRLEQELSAYYLREQGRGHRCTVEVYSRRGRVYYFTYLDDYTGTFIGHVNGARLRRIPQRPAFEVVFVFHPEAGELDLYARGDKWVKQDLEDLFARVALGNAAAAVDPGRPVFELDPLIARDFPFPTDPADGIAGVRVRKLRVAAGADGRRITLEAAAKGPREDVYDLIDGWMNRERVAPGRVRVSRVTLRLDYVRSGPGRAMGMTFDLSWPDGTTLTGLGDRERELGEKYLRRWGIARA